MKKINKEDKSITVEIHEGYGYVLAYPKGADVDADRSLIIAEGEDLRKVSNEVLSLGYTKIEYR